MLLIREIDKGNLDTDIDKSKLIKRAYNDTTVVSIVFYGMVYLIILFFFLSIIFSYFSISASIHAIKRFTIFFCWSSDNSTPIFTLYHLLRQLRQQHAQAC